MIFFRRIIIITTPILSFLAFESLNYFYRDPRFVFGILGALFCVLLISLKVIIKEKVRTKNFWGLAILPLLLYLAVCNFILILSPGILRHLVAVLFALITYAYFENLFLFYYNRSSYQVNSLENTASFYNLMIFFLIVLDLNAINSLLNYYLWLLILILLAITFLILVQLFWILKINKPIRWVYVLVILVMVMEFFWAISFLPINFYVAAMILTIIYYFVLGTLRAKIVQGLDKKILLRYIIISILLIIVILLTSHWV
ncbi:MAG: hypothetical protein NTZ49_04655 [Candidatus Parcubacteria bacterium]|nr:hypothetical protein [Candidatus Parcubacteria bacterium]